MFAFLLLPLLGDLWPASHGEPRTFLSMYRPACMREPERHAKGAVTGHLVVGPVSGLVLMGVLCSFVVVLG